MPVIFIFNPIGYCHADIHKKKLFSFHPFFILFRPMFKSEKMNSAWTNKRNNG